MINRMTKPFVAMTAEERKQFKYSNLVVRYIREKYSQDDEFAILRQRDSKPEKFEEYNSFCEECKNKAKVKLGIIE